MTEPAVAADLSGPHFQLYRAAAGGPVGWRLLGGNHRPIGRSVGSFADPAECLQALAVVLTLLDALECAVSRQPLNQWGWLLRHRGIDLVASAHSYDRQVRALNAQAQFRSQAAAARINETVMLSAARRWRPTRLPDQRAPAR
jgi:hypothetical protein